MRINFLLPGRSPAPSGGFKVAYRYAGLLAERGHHICVVHCAHFAKHAALTRVARDLGGYCKRAFSRNFDARGWLAFAPEVKTSWTPVIRSAFLPAADVTVAVGWETAEWLPGLKPQSGAQSFLFQDYEKFHAGTAETEARMRASLNASPNVIAISSATEQLARESGAVRVFCVPNGLDWDDFHVLASNLTPERTDIGFPWRPEPYKRSWDAVEALTRLQRAGHLASRNVWCFGAERPQQLPEWITFLRRPTDEMLRWQYNRTAVFVVPSAYEGWGLPACEALMCGAALVTTANGGSDMYARNEETALVVPPGEPDLLAAAAAKLLTDAALRQRLSDDGLRYIKRYTWKASAAALEAALLASLETATSVPQPAARAGTRLHTKGVRKKH